jgi:hypothetical protein
MLKAMTYTIKGVHVFMCLALPTLAEFNSQMEVNESKEWETHTHSIHEGESIKSE